LTIAPEWFGLPGSYAPEQTFQLRAPEVVRAVHAETAMVRAGYDGCILDNLETMRGDRWTPNVSACILQKMSLRHCMSDEDVPLAFVLNHEHVHKVFAKKRGLELTLSCRLAN
jgi:hypothetical protein